MKVLSSIDCSMHCFQYELILENRVKRRSFFNSPVSPLCSLFPHQSYCTMVKKSLNLKKCLFPIDAYAFWYQTWSKNLWRYLTVRCIINNLKRAWHRMITQSCFNGETQNFGFYFLMIFFFFLNQLCVDKERFSSRP